MKPSIQNYQSTVEALLDYCKTLYRSIGQNEYIRTYYNLNSICLLSYRSLQQYITRYNNLLEELIRTRANLLYRLLLFWFIEYLDNNDYRFWKESFKAKIRELSDESLEEGNWIQQAQQELLDRNIDPSGDMKPLQKRLRQNDDNDGIGEINWTNKPNGNSNQKRPRPGNPHSRASSRSHDTKSVSNILCNTCNGNHPTEKCYYTAKNPPVSWIGKPEIWRRLFETQSRQK